jgi:hypothetical protein
MKTAIKWIGDALSNKDIVADRSFYKVANQEITATNGRLTAGHPFPCDIDFLVPGEEFNAVFKRMTDDVRIKSSDKGITISSGRFRGMIATLPADRFPYDGVEHKEWKSIPKTLIPALEALRPFVSDNNTQAWATTIAIESGWAFATNNIALAGVPLNAPTAFHSLMLPVWAVDFVLARKQGLTDWAWRENYVAFLWKNGAWMRSVLVEGKFPERASELIREAAKIKTSCNVTDKFRAAFKDVGEIAEDTVLIYSDRIVSKFKQAEIVSNVECLTPPERECSIWGAKYLLPVIAAAESWSPDVWPKPVPFRGNIVVGYVVGRRA